MVTEPREKERERPCLIDHVWDLVRDDYNEDVKGKGVGVRDERAHKGVARRHPALGVRSTRRGGPCLRTAPLAYTLRAPTNIVDRASGSSMTVAFRTMYLRTERQLLSLFDGMRAGDASTLEVLFSLTAYTVSLRLIRLRSHQRRSLRPECRCWVVAYTTSAISSNSDSASSTVRRAVKPLVGVGDRNSEATSVRN